MIGQKNESEFIIILYDKLTLLLIFCEIIDDGVEQAFKFWLRVTKEMTIYAQWCYPLVGTYESH